MNVTQLVEAIQNLQTQDALQCRLSLEEWKKLAPYLSQRFLHAGDVLIAEGDTSRELFILAEGALRVSSGGHDLATIVPGMVVGEGAFFSGETRSASVTATAPGVAWALSWERYETMATRQPRLALDLTRALAVVLAVRMRAALLVGHFA